MIVAPPLGESPDIVTDRLRLRRPGERDLPAIARICGDWDVARRLARVPHPYGIADARFFLDQVVPAEWVWAITLSGDDALVATIGLMPAADGVRAELGYWLSPSVWGRGIATEAGRAVVAFAFDTLGLVGLTSGHAVDNPASGRVLAKLGFGETHRAMQYSLAAGGEVPSVRMRLDR